MIVKEYSDWLKEVRGIDNSPAPIQDWELRMVKPLLERGRAFIAGGRFRSETSKDLDIFVRTEDDVESTANFFLQELALEFNVTEEFRSENAIGLSVKSITPAAMALFRVEIVTAVHGSPEEVISTFDFIPIMSALYWENDQLFVVEHEDAIRSRARQELTLNPDYVENLNSLERLARYHKYGYSIPEETISKVMAGVCRIKGCNENLGEVLPDYCDGHSTAAHTIWDGRFRRVTSKEVDSSPSFEDGSRFAKVAALHDRMHLAHGSLLMGAPIAEILYASESILDLFPKLAKSEFADLDRSLITGWWSTHTLWLLGFLEDNLEYFSDEGLHAAISLMSAVFRKADNNVMMLKGILGLSSEEILELNLLVMTEIFLDAIERDSLDDLNDFLIGYMRDGGGVLTYSQWHEAIEGGLITKAMSSILLAAIFADNTEDKGSFTSG